MAKKKTILEKMEHNPRGDWSINDVETLCAQVGLDLKPPSNGSHYKVSSDILHGMPTVPYKRPIKAVYIRELVKFAKAHIEARTQRQAKE